MDLYVTAQDDNSGLAEMQISASAAFTDTVWEPYSALKPWTPEGGDGIKTVYARFRDSAGNISAAADASFALDTLPPLGGMALGSPRDRPGCGHDDRLLRRRGQPERRGRHAGERGSRLDDAAWLPYTATLTWPISLTGDHGRARSMSSIATWPATSQRCTATPTRWTPLPPVVYVEVAPGETLTRTVNVYAYDELADLGVMRLSNDPLMVEGVVTVPYTPTVTWTFDDRRVVWVQLSDSVGNWAEPYPAYAAPVLAPQAPTATISLEEG